MLDRLWLHVNAPSFSVADFHNFATIFLRYLDHSSTSGNSSSGGSSRERCLSGSNLGLTMMVMVVMMVVMVLMVVMVMVMMIVVMVMVIMMVITTQQAVG